jgi:hypothetical protein
LSFTEPLDEISRQGVVVTTGLTCSNHQMANLGGLDWLLFMNAFLPVHEATILSRRNQAISGGLVSRE